MELSFSGSIGSSGLARCKKTMNQANLRSASVDGSLSGAFKMKIVLTPKLSPAVEMGVAIGAVFDGKREFRIQRWVFYVAPDKMCILHLSGGA